MSPESFQRAGKLRHIPLRQSRPYHPRACFLFRLSLRVDAFLRCPALKSFSSTDCFQLEKYWARICKAVVYTTRRRKNWKKMFALDVVVDVCCWLFFSLGVVEYCSCTYICTCYSLRGLFSFQLVTHTPTLHRLCADAHRFTPKCWLVGGVRVGGTNQSTHHPTHPANHLPTHSHPSTHVHPAMQGFCADARRFNIGSDPKTIAGTQKK